MVDKVEFRKMMVERGFERNLWQLDLVDKYPQFFNADEMYRYGFGCGNGWESVIESMLEKLAGFQDNPEGLQIVQIKEKFGGLRVYVNFSTPNIHNLICDAEEEALQTCEKCGTKETNVCLRKERWTKNLCDACETLRQTGRYY